MDYGAQKHPLLRFCCTTGLLLWFACAICHATPSETELSIWSNEAIVTTYTFTAANFLERQKEIAKYFTAQGWINYTKAMQAAKLRESVQKNNYVVSAVALLPPTIKSLANNSEWQATMPLLVLYKNKDYQQKQTLEVVITFATVKANEGVRGLALSSFTSKVTTPACRCEQTVKNKIIV